MMSEDDGIRFEYIIRSIRQGTHLCFIYEQNARDIASRNNFSVSDLEKAMQQGSTNAFRECLNEIESGRVYNEIIARELSKRYDLPAGELELSLAKGYSMVFKSYLKRLKDNPEDFDARHEAGRIAGKFGFKA